jgi:hypothetical protein
MTSARNHYEWHLVGHGSDPVPPSRHDIDVIANDLRHRGEKIASIADTLRRLSKLDGWRGEAAEKFSDKAADVLDDLGKVTDRYAAVAGAMSSWAGAVDTARQSTLTAVLAAEDADARRRAAQGEKTTYDDPTPEQAAEQSAVADRLLRANDDLDDARQALGKALADLDDAASTAKGAIDKAADIWDDGTWGDFKGFLRKGAELVEVLCKALEVIGAILGAVILVLAIVASAPFALVVAALVAGVLLLAGHLFLMYVDEGDVTWSTIALDVLNVALGAVGLKGVTSALSGLKGMVPALATRLGQQTRLATELRLSSGQLNLYRNALRFANPGGRLAGWAESIRRTADIAEVTQRVNVQALADLKPSSLAAMLHQDREVAELAALVKGLKNLPLNGQLAGDVRMAEQLMRVKDVTATASTALWLKDLPGVPDNVKDIYDYARHHPIHVSVPPVWRLVPVH